MRASDELADVRHKVDSLRRERNSLSSSSSRTPRADELASRKRAKEVKQELKALEQELRALESSVHDLADSFPNESHRLAPVGSEDLARVARYVHFQPRTNQQGGDVPPAEPARDHLNISAMLSSKEHHQHLQVSSVDMRAGSLISGSSWPVMSGLIARLSHALAQYALSRACAHGFMPTVVPDVVRAELAHRTGFKPRDDGAGASQTYFVDAGHATATRDDPQQVVLAGTAEIPLVGLLAGQTLSADAGGDGAVRLVALANAFRAEAGARGADTRGLYRVHQFSKVELVVACDPSRSDSELERLVCVQTDILSGLGLPIRVLDMPTEELGASACRKFDIEAWMPGRGKWGEVRFAFLIALNAQLTLGTNSSRRRQIAQTIKHGAWASASVAPHRRVRRLRRQGVGHHWRTSTFPCQQPLRRRHCTQSCRARCKQVAHGQAASTLTRSTRRLERSRA